MSMKKEIVVKAIIVGLLVLIAADHFGDSWFDRQEIQEAAANIRIQLAGK